MTRIAAICAPLSQRLYHWSENPHILGLLEMCWKRTDRKCLSQRQFCRRIDRNSQSPGLPRGSIHNWVEIIRRRFYIARCLSCFRVPGDIDRAGGSKLGLKGKSRWEGLGRLKRAPWLCTNLDCYLRAQKYHLAKTQLTKHMPSPWFSKYIFDHGASTARTRWTLTAHHRLIHIQGIL